MTEEQRKYANKVLAEVGDEENEVIVEQPQTAEGDQSTSQANTTASK